MREFSIKSSSPDQTFKIGLQIAEYLIPGDIMFLIGDLGAGKTVFVKGLGAGLGVKKDILSPTFVCLVPYRGNITNLVHIDAYRFTSLSDLKALGIDEYFDDSVIAIEWADKIKEALYFRNIELSIIACDNPNERLITFGFYDDDDRWMKFQNGLSI
jgi:tRNA threonylcarbamoyladenosine biosynthesis protein TsaE